MNDMSHTPECLSPNELAILDTLVLEMPRRHLQTFVSERHDWITPGPNFDKTLRGLVDAGLIIERRASCLRQKTRRMVYRRPDTPPMDLQQAEAILGSAWQDQAGREGHMKRFPVSPKNEKTPTTKRITRIAKYLEKGPMMASEIGRRLGTRYHTFKNDLYRMRASNDAHCIRNANGHAVWHAGPAPIKTPQVRE